MSYKIKIQSTEDVLAFVNAAARNNTSVLVIKDGFSPLFDGASLVAMMSLISSNIIVKRS